VSAKEKLFIDILERAFFTWGETFLGLLLVANIWTGTEAGKLTGVLGAAQVAAVAALPAALAVIKGALASLLGNRNTAAALPADVTA
jgi:hypothetical protein